jgi:tetraacyldisaccharide 4'-kinase
VKFPRMSAQPVTTPKDATRLPAWARASVRVAGVSLVWDDPAAPIWIMQSLLR